RADTPAPDRPRVESLRQPFTEARPGKMLHSSTQRAGRGARPRGVRGAARRAWRGWARERIRGLLELFLLRELGLVELGVPAARGEQFGVRPRLHHAPGFEHQDLV